MTHSSTQFTADTENPLFFIENVLQADCLFECPAFQAFDAGALAEIMREGAKFAETVIAPINQPGDRIGCKLEKGKVTTSPGFREAWHKLSENGWLGISNAAEYGGMGLPEVYGAMFKEFATGACPGFGIIMLMSNGVSELLRTFGSDDQKQRWCEKLNSGEYLGTMCLTEPQAGSFLGDVTTRAAPTGKYYKMDGGKIYITGGDHDLGENIIHMVLARLPDAPQGTKGLSLFAVPKFLDSDYGKTNNHVTTVNLEEKMGLHSSPTCTLAFGDGGDCFGEVMETPGKGIKQMFVMMNEARLRIGLQASGQASAAYRQALAYANERRQGITDKSKGNERALIVEYPDIRDSLLYMRSSSEALRCLILMAHFYVDLSRHDPDNLKRDYYRHLVDFLTPICKAYSTDEALDIVSAGIQVCGGAGYLKDLPLEQNYRDLRVTAIYEGTNGIQYLDLLMRKMTIENGALYDVFLEELSGLKPADFAGTSLEKAFDRWQEHKENLEACMKHLLKHYRAGKNEIYVLHAKKIGQFFGDVTGGYCLLRRAAVALKKYNGHSGEEPDDVYQRVLYRMIADCDYYVRVTMTRCAGLSKLFADIPETALLENFGI